MMKRVYEIESKVFFEPDACRLWPAGEPDAAITLYAPVSQCLHLMLQHPLETLSQEFFFEEVWRKNGLYVNANTLYQNMALLRKALKSLGIVQDIIKTIPRRGIKFTGSSRLINDVISDTLEEPVKENSPLLTEVKPDIQGRISVVTGDQVAKENQKMATLYLPLIIILVIALWLFTLLTKKETADSDYLSDYYPAGLVRNCTLFSSSSDKENSHYNFFEASRLTGVHCINNDRAWITFNDRNSMVSVVKCDRQITQDEADCTTWIFREAGNE